MSGTTAIVVLVNKGSIHVANVGDSRAIIAQVRLPAQPARRCGGTATHAGLSAARQQPAPWPHCSHHQSGARPPTRPGATSDRYLRQMRDNHLTAYSLSQDQTPFRKDERERCKRAGAQVHCALATGVGGTSRED